MKFAEQIVAVPRGTGTLALSDIGAKYGLIRQTLLALETAYGSFTMTKRYPDVLWGENSVVDPRTGRGVTIADLSQWVEISFDAPVPLGEVVALLKVAPEVEFVDAPYVYHLDAEPSDALYDQQWNLEQVSAPEAWDLAPLAEGGGVRRVLALVEAHLEAGAGRYTEAAALVEAVAAEEAAEGNPESGIGEALFDLAAVYAERAGGSEGARGAGSEVLARGGEVVLPETAEVSLTAYPNPSAGETTLALTLPNTAEVSVIVYDVLGRRVASLAEGPHAAGTHRFGFGGRGLPSGVYLVRAETPDEVLTRRITLLR